MTAAVPPLDSRIRAWLATRPATIKALTEAECVAIAFQRFARVHPNYFDTPADFANWLKFRGYEPKQIRTSPDYAPPAYGYFLRLGGDDDPSERPMLTDQGLLDSSIRHWVGSRSLLQKARTIEGANVAALRRALVQTWREDFPGYPINDADVLDAVARAMGYADAAALLAGAVSRTIDGVELRLALPATVS